MLTRVRQVPLWVVVVACATLGLAPFSPPHVVEKLRMLADGELAAPVDVFDLVLHSSPWVLLALRVVAGRAPTGDGTDR